MICNRYDVVVVPFPFVDVAYSKSRPVLVLSHTDFHQENGQLIGAMITTGAESDWVGDTPIRTLGDAGLQHHCVIRLKLFTLPLDLVSRKIGALSPTDQRAFKKNWDDALGG